MKTVKFQKALAMFISLALVLSCFTCGIMVSAARNSAHTTEDFEGDYLKTYYGGTSNANTYTINESTDMKYKNFDDINSSTAAGHHIALPVNQTGIGHNGSDGVMRLLYDGNYPAEGSAYNPGFSVRDNAGGDGKSHQPDAGTTYYVSLWYKAEELPVGAALYIAQASGSITNFTLGVNNLTAPNGGAYTSPVKMTDITEAGDWVKATAKYSSTLGGSNLIIFMASNDKTKCGGTSVLIDDISIDRLDRTVSFDTDGGSAIASVKASAGYPIDLPAEVPVKAGYKFAGWYTDAELTVPVDSGLICGATDFTLYAKWEAVESYTVTFDSAGGTSVEPLIAEPYTEITAKPFRVGYTFDGWYSGDNKYERVPETDITLTAKWTVIADTVQGYEDFEADTDNRNSPDGIHGNGSGVKASDKHAHNGSNSILLNMNQNSNSLNAATILKSGTTNKDIRVVKGQGYKVSFWAYTEEALTIDFRLATYYNAVGSLSNSEGYLSWEEAYSLVTLPAGEWTEVTLIAPEIKGTTKENRLDCLAVTTTFDGASTSNAKPVYLDDIDVQEYAYTLVGDSDFDGSLGAGDMVVMRKKLLGLLNFYTDIDKKYFDMNTDSKIDILDLIRLKKAVASSPASASVDNSYTVG